MLILAVFTILAITITGILLGRKVTQPPEESETPPGAYILDNPEIGYSYLFDNHFEKGTCYRSRGAAIRAAWHEYHRILKKGTNA